MGSQREKMVLFAILAGSVAVAIIAGIGIYWFHGKTVELRAANGELQAKVTDARAKSVQLPALRVERNDAQVKLETAQSILPSQAEIENLVENLSEFAQKSGVVIVKAVPIRQGAYKPQKGAALERFREATFDLDIQGNFFQFVEFLNYLENYKRFIRIDEYAVTPGKTESEPHEIRIKFATFTYVEAQAEAPKGKANVAEGAGK